MANKNPALDFLSPHFDPLLALSTPGLEPPLKSVQPRDNITRCLDLLPDSDPQFQEQSNKPRAPPRVSLAAQQKRAKQELKELARQKAESILSHFSADYSVPPPPITLLLRQPPVRRPRRTAPASATSSEPISLTSPSLSSSTSETSSDQAASSSSTGRPPFESESKSNELKGPLSLLKTLFVQRQRVRIYLTRERGVRGHCDAYIKAFDKHMNMVRNNCKLDSAKDHRINC
jgi:small nuclear ribonucleoprotein (snRNP)-like protein